MRRGTTPTFEVDCDVDLTGYTIFLTLEQGTNEITLTPDCEATQDGCKLFVTLTQEQTLSFRGDMKASMQIRAVDQSGLAIASNIMTVDIGRILLEGVIDYDA